MSGKRRDRKNRILRTGESQRADGMYMYRYVDLNGKTKCIYSWRLVDTDPIPTGKKDKGSLREKEKLIQRDLDDKILPDGAGLTVLDLTKKYIGQKTGVKRTTRAGYNTVLNLLERDPFGAKRIDRIRLSDAKEWLIRLQQEGKKSYSTIHSIRGVLRPAFQMAVDDDILRKNPFGFVLATVLVNDAVTRDAITRKEERTFLEFVKNDKHYCKYYDGMYILFKTGMRISEFTGLTINDIDMVNRTINIDHQLQKTGTSVYIDTAKTCAGKRVIPMADDVYACFGRILEKRDPPKVEPMIDGYSGFLWFDKNGKPMVAMHWEKYFQHAVERYNSIYKLQLPKITPHVCRHTYCSNMAKSGMNPKVLQYLMGHSDISVTLNTYTHLKLDDARAEMENLREAEKDVRLIANNGLGYDGK
ncbi:MAG: tyrosine-type recombinase/integrase [Lachnospiraceae bacterium]|jgi:integrase|nr:tyrosine-type recombinase/integrase [Lachnospiraceae bacterium]